MVTNTTWMSEGGLVWKQRFIPKVTDPDFVAEVIKACADTHLITKTIKEYRDLRGERLVTLRGKLLLVAQLTFICRGLGMGALFWLHSQLNDFL